MYTIYHQGKEIKPKPGNRWLWSKAKFDEAYNNNEIVIGESEEGFSVRFKQYLRDEHGKLRNGKPLSIKQDVFNQEGTNELATLLGKKGIFDFPKPSSLLKYFYSFIVNDKDEKDGIYLDFFAGSCPTAQAIIELNEQDGGDRKFICVQLPELTDEKSEAYKSGYKSISSIGKARIKRVIDKVNKLRKELEKSNDQELFKEKINSSEVGFKAFCLQSSNFKGWDAGQAKTQEAVQAALDLHVDHLSPSAQKEGILYEILLKSGFELTTSVEKLEIDGKDVFSIENGELLVCLEKNLTHDLIKAIAERQPTRVICLDEGFQNNDQLKTNAVQIMKSKNVVSFRTV